MTLSYNWLKKYLDIEENPETIAEILTNLGLEVEGTETVEQIPGALKGVITARVLRCEPHPNSDHLHVCSVDTGETEPLQIVCGAPNIAQDQKVLLATLGTVLHFNGEEVKIKKSKIRGLESFGMICAEDELGIGRSHEGIMVLPPETPVGMAAKDFLHLRSDTVFQIDLTPNRVDAASHLGAARDLKAWYASHGIEKELLLPSVQAFAEGKGKGVDVEIRASEAVLRYAGITLTHVNVGPSPDWLSEALLSVGLHPVNNVVDVTNFILYDLGQPLHAFDRGKITGDKIVVRFAEAGTRFVTLDGVERTLDGKDLMICNEKDPMCIGGVFGGLDSGVGPNTREVFLESACFHPLFIRKTAKRHGLKTEASFRYERGTDPNIVIYALKRAALLLQEIAGAHIENALIDIYPHPISNAVVALSYDRMFSLIGKNIGKDKVNTILKALEIKILESDENGARVEVPAYRVDVKRECDVIEDVLRVYGYDHIELPSILRSNVNHTEKPDALQFQNKLADYLASNGFHEIMCNSLTKLSYYENVHTFPKETCVRILNPLSSDLQVLRRTLLFGGLETLARNQNRKQYNLKIFETGHVYRYDASEDTQQNAREGKSLRAYSEAPRFCLLITGDSRPLQWRSEAVPTHFFELKSYVEQLFALAGVDICDLDAGPVWEDIFDRGIAYSDQGATLAVLGRVSAKWLQHFDIKQEVFAAEIVSDALFQMLKNHRIHYVELPKFPEVKRDLALVVDREVSYAQLRDIAFDTEKRILRRVQLFDVYTGENLPAGKKQYAISFYLQDNNKTLTDNYIDNVMNRLLRAFSKEVHAILR